MVLIRTYESNILWLSSKLLQLLRPSVAAARDTLTKAIKEYLGTDFPHVPGATKLVVARNRMFFEGGVSLDDISRLESSFSLGLLTNTVPATFWCLFDIFSRPELVAILREEV